MLECGHPEERSTVIRKFIGQIVPMSQQKFASNVVEKCFVFCSPEERHVLINEILGDNEDNEPLQVFHTPLSLIALMHLSSCIEYETLTFVCFFFFLGNDERSIRQLCRAENTGNCRQSSTTADFVPNKSSL